MNKSVDCPLISFDYGEKSSRSKCIEDECAQWNECGKKCNVFPINNNLKVTITPKGVF